ncbi:MAG: DUF5615 family PIN-like protein [Verrucomicrobia bacterium]|nr:DUF5615 family PIN-like protein [Verrucomicrobiota bacterium]
MKFILDENFPQPALALLARYGHVGQSILDFSRKGTDDLEIFEVAQRAKAVFLTTDKDFFHTVPLLVKDHAGVVVIALAQPNRQKLLDRLQWVLRWMQQGDISGRALLVTDHHHLISR